MRLLLFYARWFINQPFSQTQYNNEECLKLTAAMFYAFEMQKQFSEAVLLTLLVFNLLSQLRKAKILWTALKLTIFFLAFETTLEEGNNIEKKLFYSTFATVSVFAWN